MSLPPVIFEDEALLVLDKPAGVSVVAGPGGRGDTLLDEVRAQHGATVTNVQRPEAEISGLVLFAKGKTALDYLSGQFQSKTAQRIHHAFVVVQTAGEESAFWPRDSAGRPPGEFAMDWWIGQDDARPGAAKAFRRNGGQPAHTDFFTREDFGAFAFIECRPQSGRRHQLRVHLAAAGLPVLNDPLYGDPEAQMLLSAFKRGYKGGGEEKPMIRQLALHASGLVVTHPITREAVTFTAPLPLEFEIALKNLRKFARRRR